MKKYFCVICLLFTSTLFAQEWKESYAEAQTEATNADKHILLVFSGSDWCAPCIKLDADIWKTDAFRTYAKTHYAMYKADFPRKKSNRLPDALVAENAALAEKYNPDGHFPLVLLLDKEGQVLGKTGYRKGTPETYIEHLNSLVK